MLIVFLEKATSAIAHRGPDDAGYYLDDHVGLGHRRLSMSVFPAAINLSLTKTGHSLLSSMGEIFNYQELMEQLMAKGHRFATRRYRNHPPCL